MADTWMVKAENRHKREMARHYKGTNTLRELFEKHGITDGLAEDFTVDNWTKTDQNKFRTAMANIGYKDYLFLFRVYKLPMW